MPSFDLDCWQHVNKWALVPVRRPSNLTSEECDQAANNSIHIFKLVSSLAVLQGYFHFQNKFFAVHFYFFFWIFFPASLEHKETVNVGGYLTVVTNASSLMQSIYRKVFYTTVDIRKHLPMASWKGLVVQLFKSIKKLSTDMLIQWDYTSGSLIHSMIPLWSYCV